ncbi:winged helix-turn-helix domain-containing protein [Halobellus rufus]|uniref:winged helix-turn-helix domain-containing protein n=1 Tax=Halobellus rufus TaxID=1448860 RepID=UPI000A5660D7|nr:winged helix-turn-helix domain-containing protein [Halobellus rufus]
MTDSGAEAGELNDVVLEDWVAETTPFERVHAVIRRTYDPQSASEIAERARVSPTTARKHLRGLVDTGAVATDETETATRYRRSETAIVTEHAEALLSEHSTDELASAIAEMKAQIRSWREEYDVESPEAFARALGVDDADTETGQVLSEWQTTRRNLSLAQAALAIDEATQRGRLSGADSDDSDADSSAVV